MGEIEGRPGVRKSEFPPTEAEVEAERAWRVERWRDRNGDPGDPSHCTCGVERRAEFSPLGPPAGCFLALGSRLGLVGTVPSRW